MAETFRRDQFMRLDWPPNSAQGIDPCLVPLSVLRVFIHCVPAEEVKLLKASVYSNLAVQLLQSIVCSFGSGWCKQPILELRRRSVLGFFKGHTVNVRYESA